MKEFVSLEGLDDKELKRIGKEVDRKFKSKKSKKTGFDPETRSQKMEPYKREKFSKRDFR